MGEVAEGGQKRSRHKRSQGGSQKTLQERSSVNVRRGPEGSNDEERSGKKSRQEVLKAMRGLERRS